MTNELFFTHHLLDRIPDMGLLADLSHYVVGQEIELPVAPLYAGMIEHILDNSLGFHGRVVGTEQLQAELSFPHHRPWVDQFMSSWAYGFRSWLRRAVPDEVLTFACELGPRSVAVSGPDGNDLSNGVGA